MDAVTPAQVYYQDARARLLLGDAADTLAGMQADSVHCIVTSPPYYGLRDYKISGQYGLEEHPQLYIDALTRVFHQAHRVLADTGTLWLNLGDSYACGPCGPRTSTGLRGRPNAATTPAGFGGKNGGGLPVKSLLGIPWRVALALQADGWILRNAVIWAKTNPMPQSVRDRLSTTYEHLFLLVKHPAYHFDLDAIRIPPKTAPPPPPTRTAEHRCGARADSTPHPSGKYTDADASFTRGRHGAAMLPSGASHRSSHPRGKNPGDVWTLATRPLRHAHFAAFPLDIPRRAIAAGCPPAGHVLDPFSGAATTGLAALESGRTYTGIDLNPDYHAIALRRLNLSEDQEATP
jgi:DNA modification methylase